uniref:Uncharacterized protein n=1 Tax=Moumouvirus sp. 'Monve' TaxID=1128131 RepID=H2EEE8_9VIRU|nr:hypothetical protein mv_R566 [Moumouvirus Monve]
MKIKIEFNITIIDII